MLKPVTVRLHQSVDEFRAIAEPLYRADPVENTIELTLLRANRLATTRFWSRCGTRGRRSALRCRLRRTR